MSSQKENAKSQKKYFPLSFQQERMLKKMNSSNESEFVISGKISIMNTIDFTLLDCAYQKMLVNYSILRTRFVFLKKRIFQEVLLSANNHIEFIDFRGIGDYPKNLEDLFYSLDKIIRIDEAPLCRVYLICLDQANYVLHFRFHHLIADGTSLAIFLRELSTYYKLLRTNGEILETPSSKKQYHDFCSHQRSQFSTTSMKKMEKYWKDKLLTIPVPMPRLFSCEVEMNIQNLKKRKVRYYIFPSDITSEILKFCDSKGLLLITFFLSALFLSLKKWTNQNDIAIASVFKGRREGKDLAEQLGLFTNIVLFRFSFDRVHSSIGFLRKIQKEVLNVYMNQDYPYGALNDHDLSSFSPVALNFMSDELKLRKNHLTNYGDESWEESLENGEWFFLMVSITIGSDITFGLQYPPEVFKAEDISCKVQDFKDFCISLIKNHCNDILA